MQKTVTVASTALACLLILLCTEGNGQSSLHLSAHKEIWFDSIVGVENSGIVNGPEYKLSVRGARTHPFFLTGETSGRIRTKEYAYVGTVKYDVYAQTLVLKYVSDSSVRSVELEKETIKEFEIFGHRFKNFSEKGFCDVLLEKDNLSLVVNRTKKPLTRQRMLDFHPVDFFYLVENGKWRPLRNKVSIIKLVDSKDKSRSLRKFIRDKRLKKKGFFDEENLVKVVTYYDMLRKLPL